MSNFPNFPLLFEQIGNFLAKAEWSEIHRERLLKMGMPADSVKKLEEYHAIALQEYHDVAQEAFDTITRAIYGIELHMGCTSGHVRIPQ